MRGLRGVVALAVVTTGLVIGSGAVPAHHLAGVTVTRDTTSRHLAGVTVTRDTTSRHLAGVTVTRDTTSRHLA